METPSVAPCTGVLRNSEEPTTVIPPVQTTPRRSSQCFFLANSRSLSLSLLPIRLTHFCTFDHLDDGNIFEGHSHIHGG